MTEYLDGKSPLAAASPFRVVPQQPESPKHVPGDEISPAASPVISAAGTSRALDPNAVLHLAVQSSAQQQIEQDVDDVATHTFLGERIGAEVLDAAHNVVNSLNKDILNTAPRDKNQTQALEIAFLKTLPSYGTVHNEEEVAKKVLNDKVGITHFHLKSFSEGGSGAKVFGVFVPDEKGQLAYVIKTMEGRPSELARELSSLQQLSDLNLHESTLPTAQTAGTFTLQNSQAQHTIFVQTAAKGKPFTSILEDVGKAKGAERAEGLEGVKQGLTKAAKSLAELHLKNQEQASPLNEEAQKFNQAALNDAYGRLNEDCTNAGQRIPITVKELETIRERVSADVEGNWGLSGYSHGDSHLENMFFDSNGNKFSFIDTPTFLASTDAVGRPIGFPAYDFAWTHGSISDKGFRAGLTADEVRSLQKVFKEEYDRTIGDKAAPRQAQNLALVAKHCHFIRMANQNQEYLIDFSSKIPDWEKQMKPLQSLIDYEVNSLKKFA